MKFILDNKDVSKARFSSKYGPRWGRMHRGIDIAIPQGTRLYSPLDGTVRISKVNGGGSKKGYGYYISIYHEKEELYTLYGHMKKLSHLKVGDKVKAGDFIGYSGNTGTSTGPHVHFEIHEEGFLFTSQVKNKDTAVNPVKYYPELENYLGKYLPSDLFNKKEEDDNMVKFDKDWQSELLVTTLENLGKDGKLANPEYWIKKYEKGEMTESELSLIALAASDRS